MGKIIVMVLSDEDRGGSGKLDGGRMVPKRKGLEGCIRAFDSARYPFNWAALAHALRCYCQGLVSSPFFLDTQNFINIAHVSVR